MIAVFSILPIGFNDSQLAFAGLPGDSDIDGDGFTPNQGDCNENDSTINPGALDILGDGIDQNCDGADGTRGGQVIGGRLLPIDNIALFLAGLQISAIGMIPTLAGLAGAGFYLVKFRTNKE